MLVEPLCLLRKINIFYKRKAVYLIIEVEAISKIGKWFEVKDGAGS
jgi:hypothetical protein